MIEVIDQPDAMRRWAAERRTAGATVAVVPTMGALHAGHLALIEAAHRHADEVIVTIFVNPLQFNQPTDFDSYPRPIDDDVAACHEAGVAAVYAPTAASMYPPGFQTHVEPGALGDRLEGPMRPGHFRGVATVVTKLFSTIRPDVAVFGRKDYQQLAIVRQMSADLDLGVRIVGIPIVREPDGLAMSSRNVRLTPDDRERALVLSRALGEADAMVQGGVTDAATVIDAARASIVAEPSASLEYVEVVDARTLEPADVIVAGETVILLAAWFGDVRLIDNRVLGG